MIQIELKEILNDRVSGSSEIFEKLILFLINKLGNNENISEYIELLIKEMGHFPIIESPLTTLKCFMDNKNDAIHYLRSCLENENKAVQNIFSKVQKYLSNSSNIFTLSNSKTILEVIKLARTTYSDIRIYVSLSLPGGEGKIQNNAFIKNGISSKIVFDHLIEETIKKCQLILIGCDAILSNGDVINKTLSHFAASIAKKHKKPFLVLGTKFKIIAENEKESLLKIKSEDDITSRSLNVFEIVPANLITEIITD